LGCSHGSADSGGTAKAGGGTTGKPAPDDSTSSEQADFIWKILILGDRGIGKTSLFERYVSKKFSPDGPEPYLEQECKTTLLPAQANKVKLELWDPSVPGQGFYRGAHAIILSYDCNSKATLEKLSPFLNEIEKYNPLMDLPKAIVGLKKDLGEAVSEDDVEKWLKSKPYGDKWIRKRVSSKDDTGVEELFKEVIALVKSVADNE